MHRLSCALAASACALAFAVATSAAAADRPVANTAASVDLKVTPRMAIVDDALTVSFRVKRRLRAGWHYEASVMTPSGYGCSDFVHKQSKRRPARGKVISFYLSPYDDQLDGGSEYCQGKATVMVTEVPDPKPQPATETTGDPVLDGLLAELDAASGDGGRLVGIKEIRFYGKP